MKKFLAFLFVVLLLWISEKFDLFFLSCAYMITYVSEEKPKKILKNSKELKIVAVGTLDRTVERQSCED